MKLSDNAGATALLKLYFNKILMEQAKFLLLICSTINGFKGNKI